LNPREAFTEVYAGIKSTDGAVVGMFPPDVQGGDIVAENAALVAELTGSG
jgi:hypothetical protein